MLLGALVFLLATLQNTLCQDSPTFIVPQVWKNPTSNKTVDESITLANAVVDTIVPFFGAATGQLDGIKNGEQVASAYSTIALADYRAGTTTHQDLVLLDFHKAMNTLGPDIDSHFNSIVVMWGLAGVDMYRTYKDAAALTFAEAAWERATQWYITPDEASQGSHPKVIRPIAERCFNGSTEGGVLWILNNSNVTAITTETVAAYVALSALLYEVTSDSKYATNAELSAQFVLDNLYNGTLVENSMDVGNCARTEASEIHSYNSGLYILGLSVLASQNATWTPVLHSVIASTVPFAAWTSETGISIEGQAQDVVVNNHPVSLKGVFVRGLYEAWNRSTSTSGDMNNYIKSWITVQYNALLNLASSGDHYSLLWQGPPIDEVLPWCQLNALDALSTRIGFAHNETSYSMTSASSASATAPQPTGTTGGGHSRTDSSSGLNIGAIVGGVIGGVAFLGVVSLLAWWVGRRRRGNQAAALNPTPLPFEPSHAAYEIKPFVIPPRNEHISPADPSPSINPLSYNPAQSTTTLQSNSALIISPHTEKNSGETHLEREPRPSGPIRPVVPDASSPAVSAHAAASLTRATAGSMDGATRSIDSMSPQEPPQDETFDPAAVPRLINLLNRIMERYQPEEAPPRYDEV